MTSHVIPHHCFCNAFKIIIIVGLQNI